MNSIRLDHKRLHEGFRKMYGFTSPVILLLSFGLCFAAAAGNAETADMKDMYGLSVNILQETTLNGTTNAVLSPISVHLVLTTLLSGAGGNSAAEIKSLLGSDPSSVQKEYLNVLESSKGDDGEAISSVSRIFYKKGIEIKDTFRENAEKNFGIVFTEIDPNQNNSLTAINDMLKNITNMTLDEGDLGADSALTVINTMRFQEGWKEEFDPQDTIDVDFYANAVNKTSTPFLVKKDVKLVSGQNEEIGAKWIHIPYNKTDLRMILVLPLKRFSLEELTQKLDSVALAKIASDNTVNTISIAIPKFDIISAREIGTPLKKLGVKEIFTNEANLSGISSSNAPLKVNTFKHDCRVRVDEHGTTATAATVSSLNFHRGSLGFPADAFFVADHPFLFFIYVGNVPAFAGVVTRPE